MSTAYKYSILGKVNIFTLKSLNIGIKDNISVLKSIMYNSMQDIKVANNLFKITLHKKHMKGEKILIFLMNFTF